MSTSPNRRARRTAERELLRLQRRLATDPARPILRAAERSSPLPPGGGPAKGDEPADVTPGGRGSRRAASPVPPGRGPGRGSEESTRPPTAASPIPQFAIRYPLSGSPVATDSASPTHTPPPDDGSLFPPWARLLTLPPGLDPAFRAFLFEHIQHTIRPTDPHEHWLAARIATAMARLHLNAQREPETPSPAWLRYEQLADRQLRAAQRDLKAHRATQPTQVALPTPPAATPPAPLSGICYPQSLPIPQNPTLARLDAPLPATPEALVAEIQRLTTLLTTRRGSVEPRSNV